MSCLAFCRSWSEREIVLVSMCASAEVLPISISVIGGGGHRTGLSPFYVVGPCMRTKWLTPKSHRSYIWELIMQAKQSLSEMFLRSQRSSVLLKMLHRASWRLPRVSLNSDVLSGAGSSQEGRSGSFHENFDKFRISIWAEGVFEEKQQWNGQELHSWNGGW